MDPETGFTFNPLDIPTDKEASETRKIDAETFKIYVDMGALDAVDEVRTSVFGGDHYSREIKLDPSLDLKAEAEADAEIKAQEALAKAAQKPAQITAPKVPGRK